MSESSEEFRLLNNVAVLLDTGWDVTRAIRAIRDDVHDPDVRNAYDRMLMRMKEGAELGIVIAESGLIQAATTRLLIRSGSSAGMLQERVRRAAQIVRHRFQGGWDPHQRFLETWLCMVNVGLPVEDALGALVEDFGQQPLGELAMEMLKARREGRPLHQVARQWPELFNSQACELLEYGERRNLALALESIIKLV